MRIELLRAARAWAVGARGINYYIPLVPRDGGDPQPPLIATWNTSDLAVFEETTHDWVAERKDPPALPAVFLMVEGSVDLQGYPEPNGYIQDTSTPTILVARYITNDSEESKAKRDAEYTLRAIRRSFREWMKDENYDLYRLRNNVAVVSMEDSTSHLPIVEQVGNCQSAGAMLFAFNLRDTSPSF